MLNNEYSGKCDSSLEQSKSHFGEEIIDQDIPRSTNISVDSNAGDVSCSDESSIDVDGSF